MPSKQVFREKEIVIDTNQEKYFPRILCNCCTKLIGIINLKDKKYLCFMCYDKVKFISGLKFDEFENMELSTAIDWYKKAIQPPKPQEKK